MLCDRLAQEGIALLGAVAVKSAGGAHFVHCRVHGADDRLRQRAGDIADAQPDEVCIRVIGRKCRDTPGDLAKQVAALQTGKILVYLKHKNSSIANIGSILVYFEERCNKNARNFMKLAKNWPFGKGFSKRKICGMIGEKTALWEYGYEEGK